MFAWKMFGGMNLIILGIDPGTATTGYGVINVIGNKFKAIDYGVILTPAAEEMAKRLITIYERMNVIIETYQPEHVAIESLFFNKNVTTAITVGQARGVVMLSCAQRGVKIYEYTPLEVKQAVVGYGRADKAQVQHMVKTFLSLTAIPKPDDAADGLAIAICHAHHNQTQVRRVGHDQLS